MKSKSTSRALGGMVAAILAAVAIVGVPAPMNSQSPEKVRFNAKAPTTGLNMVENLSMVMSMNMNMHMGQTKVGTFSITQSEVMRKLVNVMGVKGGIVNAVKVTYEKASETKTEDGTTSTTAKAMQGKTYLLKAQPSGMNVSYPDGKTPAGKEVKLVKSDFDDLGKRDALQGKLIGREFVVGRRVPDIENEMRAQILDGDSNDVRKVEVTFKGKRACGAQQCGVFHVAMSMAGKVSKSAELAVDMTGEYVVRLNGAWPVSLLVQGPITISGSDKSAGRTMVLSGGGKMERRVTYEYKSAGTVPPPPPL